MSRGDQALRDGADTSPVGFLGLGVMGAPMARNLLVAGTDLVVWNRSPGPAEVLGELGARIAGSCAEVFRTCQTVVMMLANEQVTDLVLGRDGTTFAVELDGRTLVNTGTVSPTWSVALAADVVSAGGAYVEAPVSGSRGPAEDASLVMMLAGESAVLARVEALLAHLCARQVRCGPVPRALETKLAVNVHLVTMVTGLVEAFHLARILDLDLDVLVDVLETGPMSSVVSRMKAAKLLTGDTRPQTYVSDVLYNCRLITEQARRASTATPLMDVCQELYGRTERLGHGLEDMIAVLHALQTQHDTADRTR